MSHTPCGMPADAKGRGTETTTPISTRAAQPNWLNLDVSGPDFRETALADIPLRSGGGAHDYRVQRRQWQEVASCNDHRSQHCNCRERLQATPDDCRWGLARVSGKSRFRSPKPTLAEHGSSDHFLMISRTLSFMPPAAFWILPSTL